jgi:hypothetical protein
VTLHATFLGLAVLALTAARAGCLATNGASPAAIPLVRAHAETDLDCPGSDIRIEEQLGGVYKAVGCGRKASYTAACDGLNCVVRGAGDKAIPWRDRPDPRKASYTAACDGLNCVVRGAGDKAIPWRDRPDPVDAPYIPTP